MPVEAVTYPLPEQFRSEGVRRYGFHGLSCESIVRRMKIETGGFPARAVIAHLGSGCSVTALVDGRSVDTSMGLTPTGGVVMGTRPGDLDPGVMLYLSREGRVDLEQLETMLNHDSGMIALSGKKNDVKALRAAAEQGDAKALLALKVFTRSVTKAIGGYAWLLGGLDAIVFAGGIGEHDAATRSEVLTGLEATGVTLDQGVVCAGVRRISKAESSIAVWVIPAEEDLMIMFHVEHLARSVPRGTLPNDPEGGDKMSDSTLSDVDLVLNPEELRKINAYWRACNYCCAGMLYLLANPLLREPLKAEHIKNRLLGHWGSDPGQTFTWVHLNRVIKKFDLDLIYISGPGHGAPATLSNSYLEGVYSEVYPAMSQDLEGMQRFFKHFSFPGGIGSHCTPETPGSIHEGGELGYSIAHGFGAAFDNPDLIVAVVVGDGEAETGPLATSWHSNKFLNPVTDGAVLPILHLNGYKIANPTILARIPHEELESLMRGYGWEPHFVEGDVPEEMHQKMASTMEACIVKIKAIQEKARKAGEGAGADRPKWPMIVLRSPKGWTGPKTVDGHKVEGSWRAHQIPILEPKTKPEQLAEVEAWLRSYKPEELFDEHGALIPELRAMAPDGPRRITRTHTQTGDCYSYRYIYQTSESMRLPSRSRDRLKSHPPMCWRTFSAT